jgi:hypothetical protein
LAKKGHSQYLVDRGAQKLIKIGSVLSGEGEIILTKGAYLGLVHKSGKTLELKTEGTFSVQELANDLTSNDGNLSNKYAKYLVSKWSDESDDINVDYRKYLNVTGAVERNNGQALQLQLPKYVNVLNENVDIRWTDINIEGDYTLTVKNMYGKTVYEKNTPENHLSLNLHENAFKQWDILIISVKSSENEKLFSEDYALKRVAGDQAIKLKEEVQFIKNQSSQANSLNSLALANFYEENNLIVDALAAYEQAKELSPNSPQFETAYNAFLTRHSL